MRRTVKWLFALLLLANVALLPLMQVLPGKERGEPLSAHLPVRGEEVRVVSEDEVRSLPAAPPPAIPAPICLEWGVFGGDALVAVRSALKPLDLGDQAVSEREVPGKASSYWVYIPPLKSKQDAQKKVEEIRRLGIQDSFVMQDNNKWRYAVSLGLYSTEAGAAKYLAQLQQKGVKSARIEPRSQGEPRYTLLIKSVLPNLETDLAKVKQGFPGSELKTIGCPP